MRILIALDESPVSSRAAREAARLFSASGAEFLVINVARVPIPWAAGAGFGMVAPLPLDSRWLEPAEESKAELTARAEQAGVPDPEAIATSGDVVTVICAAAEEHDADVIVVGSHGKSTWSRLFDPSISAGVVRETKRPVLVVSGEAPEAPLPGLARR